ncbi:P-loop containing nucleoside triphosphate hydrolase protein [Xylariaceae sp. FL0662B]|nr:P-loop containing nucleoside triphosphate hydrolase protein [Xylariaceae sp. FL0662B]
MTLLFLGLIPARVVWLCGNEIRARAGALLWAKTGAVAALFGIQLASIILWALSPSKLLSGYLIFSSLLDIAQARSLITRGTYSALGYLCITSIITKTILICLEEVPKRTLLTEKYRNAASESTSGSINRTVFWWLRDLFRKGYRDLLFLHDLSPIHDKLSSRTLIPALEKCWHEGDQKKEHALAIATLSAFKVTCVAAALPRICLTGFRFAQPFFIEKVIGFTAEPTTQDTQEIARGLIGAAVFIYLGIALVTMVRGSLVAMIVDNTLRLDHHTAKDNEAITLMSSDIEGIEPGVQLIHEIWASVVELGIGLYLLQRHIGAACFFVVIPTIIASLLTSRLIRAMGPARMIWNKGIQKRVAEASRMLAQIKSLKITGLITYTADSVQSLRVKELLLSRKFRRALIRVLTTGQLSDQMTPVVMIAGAIFWTRRGADDELTVAELFAILSIVSLVSAPISQLISCLPNAMASIACFDRIQEYLILPDIADPRLGPSPTGSEGSNPLPQERMSTDAVVIMQGCFLAPEKAQHILNDINVSLPTSAFTAIIGPVGSGKSTILKLILGEYSLTQGSIQVNHMSVAYCDQTPWLRNISLRENILGRLDYDEAWYETVVRACSLVQDLERLSHGDMTLVGSGGIALSGGQRHRVALARAIYSRKSLLLLDDIFSALDNVTSRVVFKNLLGSNGLLRKSEVTIILAAHSVQDLACAEKVVILDEDGRITYQGEPSALPLREQDIQRLTWEPHSDNGDKALVEKGDAASTSESVPEDPEKRDSERQVGDISLYSFYFKSINPVMAGCWLVLAVIYIGLGRAPQLWLRFWSEGSMNEHPAYYFGTYSAFAASCVIASAMSVSFFMLLIVPESAQSLHEMFLQAIANGTTLNRFSQDMTLFDNRLPVAVYHTIYDVLSVLLSVALIAVGAQYFATIIPICAVALYLLAKFYLRTSCQIRHLDLEAKSPLYTLLTDTIDGLITIRAFGWKQAFLEDGIDLLDASQKPYYLLFCIQRWLNIMLDLFAAVVATVLVAFAIKFQGATTQGALGVALLNIITFNTELAELTNNWTDLEISLGAVFRLRTFLRTTPNEDPKDEAKPLPDGWPSEGIIQMENLSAAYKKGKDLVLRNISLEVRRGQRVGICGRTGCGKSSLVLSLLGLLEVESGSIKVDGVDLATVSREIARNKIAKLPQDPVTLPGTVRQNLIQDASVISDETLVYTLQKLDIWSLVEDIGGLDVDFSEIKLSRGQQQLFCLARALLHKSKILLLDEPTSNIDHKTASNIQAIIDDEFKDRTILAVVHKLEMVVGWDLVIVMDAGKIVEVGLPEKLMKQSNSVFKSLWDSRHNEYAG